MMKRDSVRADLIETPRVGQFQRMVRVFFKRGVVVYGFVVIVMLIIVAIFTPLLAPYDPYKTDLKQALLGPSLKHLAGTDANGRDLLSRIIYGSRISLMVGIVAVVLGNVFGIMLGLIAGYFRGFLPVVIMRFIDALMSFPTILLALVIAAVLGGGLFNVMLAIGATMIPSSCRITYSQVLSAKEREYVLAEQSLGAGTSRILLLHILPNCLAPLIVLMTVQMGTSILAEAGLSFLGIGIKPPLAAWGGMISNGRQYLVTNPYISIIPGFVVMLVVFAFNMVGDGLRDALDPKLRGVI